MDSDSSVAAEKFEPPQNGAKKGTKNAVIKAFLGVFQIITGFLGSSAAFVADGINTIISVPCSLRASEQNEKNKSSLVYLTVLFFSLAALWLAVSTFFEMSMTIGYLEECVKLWVLPCVVASLMVKIFMLLQAKENSRNNPDNIFALKEISKTKFDIFVSAVIFLAIILTYWVDFYFEPIIGMALSVYMLSYAIDEFKHYFRAKKVREIEKYIEQADEE